MNRRIRKRPAMLLAKKIIEMMNPELKIIRKQVDVFGEELVVEFMPADLLAVCCSYPTKIDCTFTCMIVNKEYEESKERKGLRIPVNLNFPIPMASKILRVSEHDFGELNKLYRKYLECLDKVEVQEALTYSKIQRLGTLRRLEEAYPAYIKWVEFYFNLTEDKK